MGNVLYAIVFKGEIIEGFKPISVKAHMAKLLKADVDKMILPSQVRTFWNPKSCTAYTSFTFSVNVHHALPNG